MRAPPTFRFNDDYMSKMFEFLSVDSFESLRDGNAQFALILDVFIIFYYFSFGLRPQTYKGDNLIESLKCIQ